MRRKYRGSAHRRSEGLVSDRARYAEYGTFCDQATLVLLGMIREKEERRMRNNEEKEMRRHRRTDHSSL